MRSPHLFLALGVLLAATPGCDSQLSGRDETRLRAMAAPTTGTPNPPSPSNAFADNPAAAALGQAIFFDKGFSSDGSVACASCHVASQGWSDDRPVSLGVAGRPGGRHSLPVLTAASQRWWFWDGRTDSMWSQAIAAMESEAEMDYSRAEAAHAVANRYRAQYEAVFGALPDLSAVPARGKPGIPAWDALSAAQQRAVERVFANVGKALEAYERRLSCDDTRFDQWARGDAVMSQQESAGAAAFLRGGCAGCHSGPNFSDGEFHNIGIGSNSAEPDRGREAGRLMLALSRFNAAGPYSDDRAWGASRLNAASAETRTVGAFRTPTLRGAVQRRSFGHRGDHATLRQFLQHYDRLRPQASAVGELDPQLRGVDLEDGRAVEAFLGMLACPPVPSALLPAGGASNQNATGTTVAGATPPAGEAETGGRAGAGEGGEGARGGGQRGGGPGGGGPGGGGPGGSGSGGGGPGGGGPGGGRGGSGGGGPG